MPRAQRRPRVLAKLDVFDENDFRALENALEVEGLEAELISQQDDDLVVARRFRPDVLVLCSMDYAERTEELAAALAPRPRVLVGVRRRDLEIARQQQEYVGAEGWVPVDDWTFAAEVIAAWAKDGAPSPRQQRRLDALAPAIPPKTRRAQKREEALAAFEAELAAIDATPVAELVKKKGVDVGASIYRRIGVALGRIEPQARAKKLPRVLRHLHHASRLELVNGLERFLLDVEPADLDATRAALGEMAATKHLRLFDELLAQLGPGWRRATRKAHRANVEKIPRASLRAFESRWRAIYPRGLLAAPFEARFIAKNAAAIDRALRR